MYVCMYVCMYVGLYVIHTQVYMYTYIYIHILYTCKICICAYEHILHEDNKGGREPERQGEREREITKQERAREGVSQGGRDQQLSSAMHASASHWFKGLV